MKILISLLFSMSIFITQYTAAHGDHDYQPRRAISETVAIVIAQRAVTSMSQRDAGLGFGQLSESWSDIPKEDLAMSKKGTGYYVVSALNEDEGKTLFILMSDTGDLYDANLTGEFDGI